MKSMELLKDLKPYFYCADEANLTKIRSTGAIHASVHSRHGEGIFLRSFPIFGKKKIQTIVEDSSGSKTVLTETLETHEYAVIVHLADQEVSQLVDQDGCVIYRYTGLTLHLPENTKVITQKGDRIALNSYTAVSSSEIVTGYDQVYNLHLQEMWKMRIIVGMCVAFATLILLTIVLTVLKFASELFDLKASFPAVVLWSVLFCIIIIICILCYESFFARGAIGERPKPMSERQKMM